MEPRDETHTVRIRVTDIDIEEYLGPLVTERALSEVYDLTHLVEPEVVDHTFVHTHHKLVYVNAAGALGIDLCVELQVRERACRSSIVLPGDPEWIGVCHRRVGHTGAHRDQNNGTEWETTVTAEGGG